MWTSLGDFYRSREWRTCRENIIAERIAATGELICDYCHKPIVNEYDCIGHHKTALMMSNVNDLEVSLNPDNIMLIHHCCHNAIHERFGFNPEKKVYIVWGSPCSGKTTFVNAAMAKDDLLVDIDRIYDAINNTRSNYVYNNVMMIYRTLIDMVKTRQGRWRSAWIVRGLPLSSERERLAKEVDGELIHIEADKETCLQRAYERAEGYEEFVEDWWRKFTPPASAEG